MSGSNKELSEAEDPREARERQEDNTGRLDLGIFIASIVPEGPADKDGRIRPGGRLISLNKTSLEGVTFSDAAAILQSSPDEVELIVSQPKRTTRS
uniref:PDZ domain-containing protein n=1 Tax=Gadus morhua TaxID=8049 RepID=A0A8C5BCS2_GADMO